MSDAKPSSGPAAWIRRTLGPLFLIAVCPPAAILMWYTHVKLGGSISALGHEFSERGIFTTIYDVWAPIAFGTSTSWTVIGVFAALQLTLMRVLPGKEFRGPVTPKGNIPVYKANGPLAFAVTLGLFALCTAGLGLFPASIVYHNFGPIIASLDLFSLVFCLMLYLKGRYAPSSSDHGSSGNPLFDYYWGTELFPRVLGWDVKMFTNCRFGMMGWPVILLSFAAAQQELYGLSDSMVVAVAIQLVYVAKFFWWETGYLSSLDIMHDRAGFYICWGCLVWVPSVYTSSTLYLVNHPIHLGTRLAAAILVAGVVSVMSNYFADAQRQRVRATNGQTRVWGQDPVLIVARYTTAEGERRQNLLLASGWWGISRHFHYVPEILGAFFWTLPGLFGNFLPWFYTLFLTILLTDRANRDDKRCALKYGPDWEAYSARVPYKILPGLH